MKQAALVLSVIQFFFFTTWIVYVVYLGELLEKVGIGKEYLVWFILLDQLIFALSDTAMGYAADKVEAAIGKLGGWIIGINLISCLAFLSLPYMADSSLSNAGWLFTILIVIWIATSSVLRAPPIVLLMKYSARSEVPSLAALSLLGLALGGAVSPYLGLHLKSIDPEIPFVLTSLTLFAVTLGLVWVQKIAAKQKQQAPVTERKASTPRFQIFVLLAASLLIGFGFQVHYFLNTKTQYLQFADQSWLVYLIPVFWIGFKLFAFPGAWAAKKYGAVNSMLFAAIFGTAGLLTSSYASSLEVLIFGQLLAGAAWGVVFMAGISAALGMGSVGKEGLILGAWFGALSVAAVTRMVFVISGLKQSQSMLNFFQYLPYMLWALAAMLLWWLSQKMKVQRV